MERKLPTVAIALFVKNEFSDIKGWIAWHFALGVKTLFIFDDHSSDGTWEILQAAAQCYDIRLFRTDPITQPNFYWRQKDSFLQAVEETRDKYDWLGFLDGDEYLYIKHFDSAPEFFYRFDHADAVAFSWRIYGHDSVTLRSRFTTVEAFLKHSTPEFGPNRLIKSFVRPEKIKGDYRTPHWFDDIDATRYVRPHGGKVPHIGPEQSVDWSDAFIMHYICRSMEHFIERVKKRPDTASYWHGYNPIELTDREPLNVIPKLSEYLVNINKSMLSSAITKLKSLPFTKNNMDIVRSKEIPSVFRVKTHWNTYLYCDVATHTVIHATEENAEKNSFLPIIGLIYPSMPKMIVLQVQGHNVPFLKTMLEPVVDNKLIYRVDHIADERSALFKFSGDLGVYACFLPVGATYGNIEVNRLVANDHENITLEYLNDAVEYERDAINFHVSTSTTANDVIEWLANTQENPSSDQFLSVLYSLSPSVRNYISQYLVPGLLWPFI